MSNPLTDTKAELAGHLKEILGANLAATETVKVLPYEPREVVGGQITVTVTPSNMQPDYLTFVTRIYCPFPDALKGQERQEALVAVITDELGAKWLDPQWQFGWNDRLDLFMAEAIIATPRGMV